MEAGETTDDNVFAGCVNVVERIGSTIRRPATPWTPSIHALLDHLAAAGFNGAPRAHGYDEEGREILDYVPGQVYTYPLPDFLWSDATLRAVGALVRDYHNATAGFRPPAEAVWCLPDWEPAEVICHGDISVDNCVFRDGQPVALIDFDTAHPGPRVWDFAYAAYHFVPLTDPAHSEFARPIEEQVRRLRLFADSYGLDDADRAALPDATRERLEYLVRHIRSQAAAGDPTYIAHVVAGHDGIYQTAAEYADRHGDVFRLALG